MKTKTIKQVLRKKFDEFVQSISDERVKSLVKNNSIITGGSIPSMLLQEEPNDYDVYFTNKETVIAVCKYYTKEFNKINSHSYNFIIIDDCTSPNYEGDLDKSRIKIRVNSDGIAISDDIVISDNNTEVQKFSPVYISPNAISLSDKFQLIIRFYGNPEEIHTNYDFIHCKCVWIAKTGELITPAESLECLLTKELRYSGSKYPLASIIRTRKFINRGFTINAGQYLKMCLQLNDLDLRDVNVMEDQLTGVDFYYFAQMIACIDKDRLLIDIDNTYIFELIDRFF